MKKLMLASVLLISLNSYSAEEPKAAPVEPVKVTVRDAKKACKEEGKKDGEELLKCIKEKKGTE